MVNSKAEEAVRHRLRLELKLHLKLALLPYSGEQSKSWWVGWMDRSPSECLQCSHATVRLGGRNLKHLYEICVTYDAIAPSRMDFHRPLQPHSSRERRPANLGNVHLR